MDQREADIARSDQPGEPDRRSDQASIAARVTDRRDPEECRPRDKSEYRSGRSPGRIGEHRRPGAKEFRHIGGAYK